MNTQFVRLDDDVCETINRLAEQEQRTVSALLKEPLRECQARQELDPAEASW